MFLNFIVRCGETLNTTFEFRLRESVFVGGLLLQ